MMRLRTILLLLGVLFLGCATLSEEVQRIPSKEAGYRPTLSERPECLTRLLRVFRQEGLELRFAHIDDAGVTQMGGNWALIWLNVHLPSSGAICETLAHELGHVYDAVGGSLEAREVFAEAVGLQVARALGLSSKEQSLYYLALFPEHLDVLDREAERIASTASRILEATR